MSQTLEQRRASYAWKCVNGVPTENRRDYTNLAKAAPMMVMNSGLIQTLAFLNEKGKTHHVELMKHVAHWIIGRGQGQPPAFKELMQALIDANPVEFRQFTAETHAVLRWIRQLAPAV